jgi:hypothetical protein
MTDTDAITAVEKILAYHENSALFWAEEVCAIKRVVELAKRSAEF